MSNQIFSLDHINILPQDYKPTEQCYLGHALAADFSSENRDKACFVVMEKKADGTLIVVDQQQQSLKGDYSERMKEYYDLIKSISLKYNCVIITAQQKYI